MTDKLRPHLEKMGFRFHSHPKAKGGRLNHGAESERSIPSRLSDLHEKGALVERGRKLRVAWNAAGSARGNAR